MKITKNIKSIFFISIIILFILSCQSQIANKTSISNSLGSLKLEVSNKIIGTNTTKFSSKITINSSSKTSIWVLEINNPEYNKIYKGLDIETIKFPPQHVGLFRNGDYNFKLYYEKRPNEIIVDKITIDNSSDITKPLERGVDYEF